ncbi:TauD/TfdA family dioxygenase [Micromonospora sp. WMMD1082]|uniref:TauD/TfdA family dioxygenase n=1 Tax=Micromonospora sp. WMMD1082 TaxID=3016104 RepID=UPI002417305F|nr:TauD/TfdA family dioxygenase [Micromonospora sp. WMMD1082]MDG4797036.1 TauD/TfdA family dioxygenase [Micromonospora sp. WMMD1082]
MTATAGTGQAVAPWRVDIGAADAVDWVCDHRVELRQRLAAAGVVHLRGLALDTPARFAAVVGALVRRCPRREPFAPRPRVLGEVYGAPTWPAYRDMCPHNEQSHALEFPAILLLAHPAGLVSSGQTLLADGVETLSRLSSRVREAFLTRGWMLVRNFRPYVGMGWGQAFEVATVAEVEAYCAAQGIGHEWLPDGTLRTRQARSSTFVHPDTGSPAWFNQIAFLSEWSLQPDERDVLVGAYGRDGLPFNTCYGDGEPVPAEDLVAVQEAIDASTVRVSWTPGDLLVVDNVRMAHGRTAHHGMWPLWEAQGDSLSRC